MTPSAGQFYGSQIPMGMNISHMQKPTVGAVSIINHFLFILNIFKILISCDDI